MLALQGRTVRLREVRREDAEALRAIHATPQVAAWWGQPGPEFPFDDDPHTTPMTMLRDGAVVGYLQFAEEPVPDDRHAGIDLFVDPAHHREGLARDAIATVVEHLAHALGHHRITIDPAVDNVAAIRCYEAAGFRTVGVTEASWRDPATGAWRDGLLMERVIRPAAGAGP
jgi:RimJ/RimL family protein N-acetyltransferase